jgi:hypothetical protein
MKLLVAIALLCAIGCNRSREADLGDPDSGQSDSDADTDGDSDADSDGDTDGDTGAPTCPLSSGWPCACTVNWGDCDDGTLCGQVLDLGDGTMGLCLEPCDEPYGPCPDTFWEAESLCILTDQQQENFYCGLLCQTTAECPPETTCQYAGEYEGEDQYLCHP